MTDLRFVAIGCGEETAIQADQKSDGKVDLKTKLYGRLAYEGHNHIDIGEKFTVASSRRRIDKDRILVTPAYSIHQVSNGIQEELRDRFKGKNAIGFFQVHHFKKSDELNEDCFAYFYVFVSEQQFEKLRAALTRGSTPKPISFDLARDPLTDDEKSKDGWLGFGWEPDGSGMVIRLGEKNSYSAAVLAVTVNDEVFAIEEPVFQASVLRKEQETFDREEQIENAPLSVALTENQEIIQLLKKLQSHSEQTAKIEKYILICAVVIALILFFRH